MNKLKYLYIILLSILFLNNNVISMEKTVDEQEDYNEQLLMLCLPDEVIVHIINQDIALQVEEAINNWDDIFTSFGQKILKDKIEEMKGLRSTSRRLRCLFYESLTELKKHKQKKFLKLFESLKNRSKEEYKDLSNDQLNNNLIEILELGLKISKEDLKSAVKLILAGADVNAQNRVGDTALMRASIQCDKEIVQMLIQAGANVNAINSYGWSALMKASEKGHREIVALLLANNADINTKSIEGYTALIIASRNGHKNIVTLLLANDANVNAQNNAGYTALIWASLNGHKEIVELLLSKDADVNTKNNIGATALTIAKGQGHKEIVELLQSLEKTNNFYSCLLS